MMTAIFGAFISLHPGSRESLVQPGDNVHIESVDGPLGHAFVLVTIKGALHHKGGGVTRQLHGRIFSPFPVSIERQVPLFVSPAVAVSGPGPHLRTGDVMHISKDEAGLGPDLLAVEYQERRSGVELATFG